MVTKKKNSLRIPCLKFITSKNYTVEEMVRARFQVHESRPAEGVQVRQSQRITCQDHRSSSVSSFLG